MAMVAGAVCSTGAGAQQYSDLEQAAQNGQQLSIATNLVAICPTLSTLGGFSLTGDSGDLFRRCDGAIQLADPMGSNFDAATAASNLQMLAGEEVAGQQAIVDGVVQPQTRAVAARVSALGGRLGSSQLGALAPERKEERILLASLEPVQVAADESGFAAEFPSGLGVFLNGSYGFGDRDATSLEAGFDFDDYSVTGGVDYFVRDNLVVGLAGGYGATDIDFDDNAGGIDTDTFSVSGYTLWNPMDELGVSALVSYGMVDYDTKRNLVFTDPNGSVNRTAKGDTDAYQLELSGSAYYDFTYESLTYGPTLRVTYFHTDVDGYTESGAQGLDLTFDDFDADSFQTALGGAVSHAISADFGVVVLQGRAEWIHEFMDDADTIDVRFKSDPTPGSSPVILVTTEDPDRDRALLGGGASVVFANGVSAFADFEAVAFHKDVESYTLTVGGRLEF